jgi:hypothetical protein
MSETVLVATEGPPLGQRALEYALRKFPDDDLVVRRVVDRTRNKVGDAPS